MQTQNSRARLAPPPRHLPLSAALANLLPSGAVIVWIALGGTTMLFWNLVTRIDYSFITFRGPVAVTFGEVTGIRSLDSRQPQSSEEISYTYSVEGQSLTGVSYSYYSGMAPGRRVNVEYQLSNPSRSRIAGMRRGLVGPLGFVIITLFPLVLLLGIVPMTVRG